MKTQQIFTLLIICIFIFQGYACKNNKKDTPEINIENDFQAGINILTKKLKSIYQNNLKNDKKKLAVLTFVNENGNQSQLGGYISNSIQVKIFDPSIFGILERELVDSLLSEHEFNQSGFVNSIDSKQLGKLIGADKVLVGTIAINSSKNLPYFLITGRIVDLESGEINSIASENIFANTDLLTKYNTLLPSKTKNIVGTYNIVISDVEILQKKEDGRNWDGIFFAPDVKIYVVTNNSVILSSKTYNEQYRIEGEVLNGFLSLENSMKIQIILVDIDDLEDDLIGKKELNEEQINELLTKKVPLSYKFGQVRNLKIKLENISK